MILQPKSIAVASFNDSEAGGNNYYSESIIYIYNSDGTLADIFLDAGGSAVINQNGVANVTDSVGVFSFFIDSGSYYSVVSGKKTEFTVINSALIEGYAIRAEDAAIAASASAKIFDSESAGLSGTIDGDYFSVVSPTAENYLDLYKNDGGTAVFQKSYPSSELVFNNINDIAYIKSTKADASSKNLFDKNNITSGYIRSEDGAIAFDDDSYVSNFIPVEDGVQYYLSGRTLTVTQGLAFYSADFSILPPIGANYESYPKNGVLTAPTNAAYVRFTVIFNGSGSARSVQLEVGTSESSYKKYNKLVELSQSRALPEDNPSFDEHLNLFDKNTMVTYDKLLGNGDGLEVGAAGWCYATIPLPNDYPYISLNRGLTKTTQGDAVLHFFNDLGARVGYSSSHEGVLIPDGATNIRINIAKTKPDWNNSLVSFSATQTEVVKPYVKYKESYQLQRKYIPTVDLSGELVTWVGDSIVKGDGGYTSWVDLMQSELNAATINKGDNGATIANIYPSASCMSGSLLTYQYDNRTTMTIFSGGTNDFENNIPIGSDVQMLSFDDSTVKGSLNKAIKWVKDNNSTSRVIVTTPLERSTDINNGAGLKLKDYRDAIIEVCEHQGVTCIDNMFNNLISIPTAYKYLYDGLHPNSEGYSVSFNSFKSELIK